MSDMNTITGLVQRITEPMFKFAVPRFGKVVSVTDTLNKGRVLVTIPSLGWDTQDKAAWCYNSDMKSLITPEKGTWVIVEWLDGNIDYPFYKGVPTALKSQIPASYDGNPNTKILFEQNTDDMIKYLNGILTIAMSSEIRLGNEASKAVAREGDAVLSNSTIETTFWTWLIGFVSVFAAWTPVPNDGGLVLKGLMTAFTAANPTPTKLDSDINEGSSVVKAVD